jgi:hypothetical protein
MSQWPRGLRRRSSAARLLRSCVRIPPGAWMFVCCGCCVLSGRGLCEIDHSSRGVLLTVARRCVWSRNLVNEEAKARYRAVENTTTMGCDVRKTNKQQQQTLQEVFKKVICALLINNNCKVIMSRFISILIVNFMRYKTYSYIIQLYRTAISYSYIIQLYKTAIYCD